MGYVHLILTLAKSLTQFHRSRYMPHRLCHPRILLWSTIRKEKHVHIHYDLFLNWGVVGEHVAGCWRGDHDEYPGVSLRLERLRAGAYGCCLIGTISSRYVGIVGYVKGIDELVCSTGSFTLSRLSLWSPCSQSKCGDLAIRPPADAFLAESTI
jgi:hypothetical protein